MLATLYNIFSQIIVIIIIKVNISAIFIFTFL